MSISLSEIRELVRGLETRVDALEAGDYVDAAELAAELTNRPEVVQGRATTDSAVVIGTTATNVLAVSLAIPAGWTTYHVEAFGSAIVTDTSGGSTGAGVVITNQMVHQSGSFATSIPWELMDLNYHDSHPFAFVSHVDGLTAVGSTRTFTWQMTRAATFAASADQLTLIVKAFRTS